MGRGALREFEDGEAIAGTRYRVVALIGEGGMGAVYEVEHVELGKRFVLKAMQRELAQREDLVARLRQEWRALARLEHPNIVGVTDAGTSGTGVPFYVMERLEGETLSARLARMGPLPLEEALEIGSGI
ncbi:MAG: serine/threonine protein kinase, partial [Sorangiineae bacterium]|nr:serine/threonine protein kinase [Sorangiineae bacterium]